VVNAEVVAGIPAVLLAHQGGWDEMLLVAGPIAVVAGLLWLARRRVTRSQTTSGEVERSSER
jgi:cyanate permease